MLFGKYTNILPSSEVSFPDEEDVDELIEKIQYILEYQKPVISKIPSGYTYLGQFISHDLSFMDVTDVGPVGHLKQDVKNLKQRRKAALDLDSIYGAGLEDSRVPYDGNNGKFILGEPSKNGMPRDFYRQLNHIAQIADPRNDENLIIAQLQVLFMNFHNRVVDELLKQNIKCVDNLVAAARVEVVGAYKDLVLHDFAKTLLPDIVYQTVIVDREGLLSTVDKQNPELAVEFALAAFRLHSMVLPEYKINSDNRASIEELFMFTGKFAEANSELEIFPLIPERIVGWQKFFKINKEIPQFANQISPIVMPFVKNKGAPMTHDVESGNSEDIISMFMRSTLRGMSFSLPTGQETLAYLKSKKGYPKVAKKIGLEPLKSDLLEKLSKKNSLRKHTPLWIYLMLEARGNDFNNFSFTRLGKLGGWLVADSLVTAAESVSLPGLDNWKPEASVIYKTCPELAKKNSLDTHVSMSDIVRFTYREDFKT